MTSARRTGLTILAVLGGTALLLRAADALPGLLSSVPRGMHVCATLAEAESRTGLRLTELRTALERMYVIAGSIATLARPNPALSVPLREVSAVRTHLIYFRTAAGEIPASLRSPLPPFHSIEVTLRAGRAASLRAATAGDGSVWQDLEWREGNGKVALRTNGHTVDLLRLARLLVKGAQ